MRGRGCLDALVVSVHIAVVTIKEKAGNSASVESFVAFLLIQ